MLHNSNASLTKFIDWQKVAKKGTLQTRRKKPKKYWKVGIELSINDNPKSRQNKPTLTCRECQKKIVEYTDLTPIIYWPAKIA